MKRLKEILKKDVIWTTRDTPLTEVARLMMEFDCSEIPVVESEDVKKVIGLVTERNIVFRTLAIGRNPMISTVGDCMTSPTIIAKETMPIDECIDLLQDNQLMRIPVVNQNGALCGVVDLNDLM